MRTKAKTTRSTGKRYKSVEKLLSDMSLPKKVQRELDRIAAQCETERRKL